MSAPTQKRLNTQQGDISPSTTMVQFPASRQPYADAKKAKKGTAASASQNATTLTTMERSRIRKENLKAASMPAPMPVTSVAVDIAGNDNLQSDAAVPQDAEAGGAISSQLERVSAVGERAESIEPDAIQSPGQDASREEFMLEARIVEEPELAHAEPLEKREDNNAMSARAKKRVLWVGGFLVAALVGLIVLVVVLLTRESSDGIMNANGIASLESHFEYKGILPVTTLQAIEQEMESPQRKAWNWLLNHPNLDVMEEPRMLQLMGLVTVYYSSDSWNKIHDNLPDEYEMIEDWLSYEIHECYWAGWIQCAGDEIVSLRLPTHGHLPREVSLLQGLSVLANEGREGSRLTGTLPSQLGIMTNLKAIRLTWAQIDGSIPSELWLLTQLDLLNLHTNNFTGSIPSELGLMVNMTTLYLDNNHLTGSIPTELGLLTSMSYVFIQNNSLTGSIPSELGVLTSLYYLGLQGNGLTASIPTELGLMESMVWLHLPHNTLTGSLPSELGLMASMALLACSRNSLTGSIPSELGLIENITNLELSSNALTGSIPVELALPSPRQHRRDRIDLSQSMQFPGGL